MSSFSAEPFQVAGGEFVPDESAREVFVPTDVETPAAEELSLPEEPEVVEAPPVEPEPYAPPEPTAEEIAAQAFEEGRVAGRAELPWDDAESLRAATAALTEATRSVHALQRSYLLEERRSAVDLAVAIAEKILSDTVTADVDALAPVIERAVAGLEETGSIEIRLSAQDRETVERGEASRLAELVESHGCALETDPTLSAGDARVLVGRSHVDLRRTELLRRVREELIQVVELEEERK